MKKLLMIFLFLGLTFLSSNMLGNQKNIAMEKSGVKFVDLNLSETLTEAQKQDKLVMLDAFSFN